MYFINIITKKLIAISYQLSAFRKPTAKSQQLKAVQGFTLIETLVAISILMIAIASPLTIAQKGVASAIYAKDQIIASYLAQDAIEYIINKSDLNAKTTPTPPNWLYEISTECDTFCMVDTNQGKIKACSGECDPLSYNDTNHIYSYIISGPSSRFIRSVKVTEVNADVEALITVLMSWEDKGKPKNLTFQTRIFNWKK